MGRLQGKVALITGGARGQGADEARLFIAEGATVYITDVLEEQGEKTATALGARFMAQDVTSAARWTEIVSAIVAEHGRIDVLVNNAGVFKVARLLDTSEEDYDRIIAINQKGVFLGMQAVAPTMCDAGSGANRQYLLSRGTRGRARCVRLWGEQMGSTWHESDCCPGTGAFWSTSQFCPPWFH